MFNKKKSNETKISVPEMYGELIFKKITKGKIESMVTLDKVSNQIMYNRVISNNYVNYYFQLAETNGSMSLNMFSLLRNIVRSNYGRRLFVDYISNSKPHSIRWSSQEMKANRVTWQRMSKKAMEKYNQDTEKGFEEGYYGGLADRAKWRQSSWKYLKACELKRVRTSVTSLLVRFKIPKSDVEHEDTLLQVIREAFSSLELTMRRIEVCLYDTIFATSPFTMDSTVISHKVIAERLLTTDISSQISPILQGELIPGQIVLGNDIVNKRLVCLNTHSSTFGGTNIIVIGKTGSGKSFLCKLIDEQILAIKDYLYITDYEGNEYTSFGETYGATFLDLKGKDGKYFEPLRMTTTTGIEHIDSEIRSNMINGVFEIAAVLMKKPLTSSQENILSECIEDYARGNNVDLKDPTTYKNSENMRICELLPKIKAYTHSKDMIARYGDDLMQLSSTFELYFKGINSYMFQNPISFNELREKKCIITRFGAFNTGSLVGGDSVDLKLKQLSQIQLVSELSRYRRSKGDSFVVKFEELQRYLMHTGSAEWLNASWTGIRKCNGSCIGIINDPSKLDINISALLNNSEYFIIGRNDDLEGMQYVFKNASLAGAEDLVRALSTMQNAFVLCYKNMKTIFKAEVPKKYANSPIFKTRDE